MAPPSRYVLPKDLDAAIKHLDDQQLDRLVSVALEERTRRKKPIVHDKSQRNAQTVSPRLPQGKLNAVRAAFKAGVTPARIAREFGISRSDVQRALAGDAAK
jgi:predicted transcriptional regulator